MIWHVLCDGLILLPPVAFQFGQSVRDPIIFRLLHDCYSWPAAYALMVSAGISLQHEVIEEFSEMVLAFAVF